MRAWPVSIAAAAVVALAGPPPARAQADPKAALLERAGFELLAAQDAARAAGTFAEALKADPQNARLHFGAGLAAYLERRDGEAQAELERALTIAPAFEDARLVLGRVLRRRGDFQGAVRAYEALVAARPADRDAADTLDRWRRESALHDRMRRAYGDRFTVSFEGPEEEQVATRVLASLDRAYWRIGDLMGAAFPLDPVAVVLYTTEQFHDVTRSPEWAAGAYDGLIRVPMRGALDRPDELDRVLAHEFTHALVRSLAARGVPTWLNEGLASAVESSTTAWADERLRAPGPEVPFADLASSFGRLSGPEAEFAYARSAVLVRRMLDEAGGVAVANLLRDLGAGVPFDAAFVHRIHRDFSDFAK